MRLNETDNINNKQISSPKNLLEETTVNPNVTSIQWQT